MTTYTDVFGGATVPPSDKKFRAVTLAASTTFYWPEVDASSDSMADIMEVTASAGLTMTLPDASQVSTGRTILLRNTGANSFAVADNASGAVASIATGEVKFLYLKDNSTAAGVWAVFTFGTGTSGADASALDGSGLSVLVSELQLEHLVETNSGAVSITSAHRASAVVCTGGLATVSLPSASTTGNGFFFLLSNAGTGTVTVDGYSSEEVDGGLSKTFNPGESAFLVCSGAEWYTVGYGRSTEFQFTQLVKDVSAGGTFVLTTQEAGNKLLKFIGTPVSPVTIRVPAIVSVYYIQCAYTGSPNLQIKTAAGSGPNLTSSDRVIAYCDGVDVVLAQTATVSTSLSIVDGSSSSPAIYFTADADTGIYRSGSGGVGITGNGTMLATFTPSGLSLATDLAVTEGGTGASDAATARTNLGISATNTPFTPTGSIAASNVQAALAELDSEKQPASANLDEYAAVNPTAAGLALLDDADASAQRTTLGLVIGTDVQAYDVDTAKLDVDQTWTGAQRGTLTTDNDLSFDQSVTNNFVCTPTAGGALTFTNHTAGQSGFVLLVNGSNYAITAAATTKIAAADLTRISATGTYLLSYLDNGTNAYVVASAALS